MRGAVRGTLTVVSHDDLTAGHEWRALYEALLDMDHGREDARPFLEAWFAARPRHVAEVVESGDPANHARRLGEPSRTHYTTSERLYAVGRVLDLLLLNHQPRPADEPPGIRLDEHYPPRDVLPLFCHLLGAEPVGDRPFHPFVHEVAEVEAAPDDDEPPTVVGTRWPGYLVGSMLLVRAGVVVRAGSRRLVPGVADRSTLYWTFWRRGRPTSDLSHGWGSNSQWSTRFRRDYVVGDRLHLNVDAALAEPRRRPPEDAIDPQALREVVRHRCSTVVDHGGDLWPFDEHLVEPAPPDL